MSAVTPTFAHRFATRLDNCGTEDAFVVLAEAKRLEAEGRSIIHLQIGEPDFDTPSNVIAKAQEALGSGFTHYTPSAGLMRMRERYAEYVCQRYGVGNITAENVVIMPGAKPVVFLTALALIDPGDEVIILDPIYPAYMASVNLCGGVARRLRLTEDTGFRFDHDQLRSLVSDKTKLLFLNSPQNPTGGVLTQEDYTLVAELARRHGFYVLSDEIYNRFVYEDEHISMLSQPDFLDQLVLLDGHSKTYAMTGWRLGFAVTNASMAQKLTMLMTNSVSCTAAFTQVAGEEALLGDQSEADAMIEEFRQRRDLIVDGLNSIEGVQCHRPKGAFYVFPNIKAHTETRGRTSSDIQRVLLHDYGVACLAGTSFGPGGEGYLRLSYAASRDNLNEAISRMREAFASLA